MAYVNDTKPTGSYTQDTKPTLPTGAATQGVPIGLLLCLTYASTLTPYTNDSEASVASYTLDIKP